MDLNVPNFDDRRLAAVFGDSSKGDTLSERAETSVELYVRGQVQLAKYSAGAKGWQLTASQALKLFGWQALWEVHDEGAHTLVSDRFEPASTLRKARKTLGLTTEQVASKSFVDRETVQNAEVPGNVTPMTDLRRICQTLALDGAVLSFAAGANGDSKLGVRLREFGHKDSSKFSPKSVLDLAEAGWLIYHQSQLQEYLHIFSHSLVQGNVYGRDSDYSYPTHDQGYRLAETTRRALKIGDGPIASLRKLIGDLFCIPLIQQELDERFAGATLSIRNKRGIVVNIVGANQNVWVRRMTLCHELGHLLWDPEQKLDSLRADDYDSIDGNFTSSNHDEVEMRANAFAVAFLAPPSAVKSALSGVTDASQALQIVTSTFGISLKAARNHITNVMNWDVRGSKVIGSFYPSDEWKSEEDFTLDIFPIKSSPSNRRGSFALLVAMARRKNLISSDTAGYYMNSSAEEFEAASEEIYSLLSPNFDKL